MTLTHPQSNAMLQLPDDLLWTDEHAWTPVVSRVEYLLTGALLVESAVRKKGRPITLKAESDMGWVTRETVDRLYAWASMPDSILILEFADRRRFSVRFRHFENAIDTEPVLGFPSRSNADWYRITLRLMEA